MSTLIQLRPDQRFVRATPHQVRQGRLLGLPTLPDPRTPYDRQQWFERAREKSLIAAEVRLIGMRAAPELYAFIGEL